MSRGTSRLASTRRHPGALGNSGESPAGSKIAVPFNVPLAEVSSGTSRLLTDN